VGRGRERYEIFCAPCHGRHGEGDGVIVRHGFPRPPSYFSADLMAMQPAEIVKTITEGHGEMYSYADRVPESDRWAIAAYIGFLQSGRRR
jgi:mono/diheme cytochrome c family protein